MKFENKVFWEDFAEIEQRLAASNLARYMQVASIAHGGNMSSYLGQSMDDARLKHPLEYMAGVRFVERDKRFAHAPVYKTSTKTITLIFSKGERVPETEVWVASGYDVLITNRTANIHLVAWTRKSKLVDIQHAVAWLLMQDKEPVVLRAFGASK